MQYLKLHFLTGFIGNFPCKFLGRSDWLLHAMFFAFIVFVSWFVTKFVGVFLCVYRKRVRWLETRSCKKYDKLSWKFCAVKVKELTISLKMTYKNCEFLWQYDVYFSNSDQLNERPAWSKQAFRMPAIVAPRQLDLKNLSSECELEFDKKDTEWKHNEFNIQIQKVYLFRLASSWSFATPRQVIVSFD